MASKVFPMSRNLLALISSGAQPSTRYLLQSYSATATAGRTWSSLPLPTLLGSISSNIKHEPSKHICSLLICGNHRHGNVLVSGFTPAVFQVRSYNSVVQPKLICRGCYFVWRHGRKYVECSDLPRHKQMKKLPTRKIWQEDYSKGEIAKAMDWSIRFKRESARTTDRTALSHNWLAGKIGTEI